MSAFKLADIPSHGIYWMVVSLTTRGIYHEPYDKYDHGYTENLDYPEIKVFQDEMDLRNWIRFNSTVLSKYRILKCQSVTPQIEIKVDL